MAKLYEKRKDANLLPVEDLRLSAIFPEAAILAANYTGTPGDDTYAGGSGADSILGEGGNDTLSGGDGADTILGGSGNDSLSGGAGNDFMVGGLGDDFMFGGAGRDTVSYADATSAVSVNIGGSGSLATGGEGTDHLYEFEVVIGSAFNDTLTGSFSANLIDGGAGDDVMDGSRGDDTYIIDSLGDMITELSINSGRDVVVAPFSYSLGFNVESLTLSGTGDFSGTGHDGYNALTGNSGNNLLTAFGGDDTLDGGAGADTLIGGTGNDVYYVNTVSDVVTELEGEGRDAVNSSFSYTLGDAVEYLTLRGSADVNGTGNAKDNYIVGNVGANSLWGGLGKDTMQGDAGNDTVYGEGGDDTMSGDDGSDVLNGGDGADIIGAGGMDDDIDGGSGADTLYGHSGNDTYWVDNVNDRVIEASGEGTDTIFASVTYTLTGRYAEVLELLGTANLDATGNSVSNRLIGNAGNNVLNGLGGNDTLTGGDGLDIFLFETGSRLDTITDFSVGDGDLIDVNAYTGGVSNAGMVSQSGSDVIITFDASHRVTVLNADQADVLSHIVW